MIIIVPKCTKCSFPTTNYWMKLVEVKNTSPKFDKFLFGFDNFTIIIIFASFYLRISYFNIQKDFLMNFVDYAYFRTIAPAKCLFLRSWVLIFRKKTWKPWFYFPLFFSLCRLIMPKLWPFRHNGIRFAQCEKSKSNWPLELDGSGCRHHCSGFQEQCP